MNGFASFLFIDPSAQHSEILIAGLRENTSLHWLSQAGNPLAEIASVVSRANPVERIAILTCGMSGELTLSGRKFDQEALKLAAGPLAEIRAALAPGADVLLMTCSRGVGRSGRVLTAALEASLGVPVIASETDLGAEAGASRRAPAAILFAPTALASYPAPSETTF